MNSLSYSEIIGKDISRNWLDIHCLTDSRRLRLPNTEDGHGELEEIADRRIALVCFKANGGHEWRLYASLKAEIQMRQLRPAQAEAFGRCREASANTGRIDAESNRPNTGKRLTGARNWTRQSPRRERVSTQGASYFLVSWRSDDCFRCSV